MRYKFLTFYFLLKKYKDHCFFYWKNRHSYTLPSFKSDEADFLPSALSIQAKPVSPAGRLFAFLILIFIIIFFMWSYFGHFDIVVNGQGRVIVSGHSKFISSSEVARVSGLYVSDGQRVKKGDVLIELDTRIAQSDLKKYEYEKISAMIQIQKANLLIKAIDSNVSPIFYFKNTDNLHENTLTDAKNHLTEQWNDYLSKKSIIDNDISKLTQSLLIASKLSDDFKHLLATNDVSRHSWLEKESNRINLEGQLLDAQRRKDSLLSELKKNAQELINESNRTISASLEESNKAKTLSDLLILKSPVDGVVNQLSIHTVGGVVPAAQPIMQIVPDVNRIEFEAYINNKDVGFVQVGQIAKIKIDSYDYTKYGYISARVINISHDSIADEKLGLVYAVKLEIDKSQSIFSEKIINIMPGMSGVIEIKTGDRRIIDYILSPIMRLGKESLNER